MGPFYSYVEALFSTRVGCYLWVRALSCVQAPTLSEPRDKNLVDGSPMHNILLTQRRREKERILRGVSFFTPSSFACFYFSSEHMLSFKRKNHSLRACGQTIEREKTLCLLSVRNRNPNPPARKTIQQSKNQSGFDLESWLPKRSP